MLASAQEQEQERVRRRGGLARHLHAGAVGGCRPVASRRPEWRIPARSPGTNVTPSPCTSSSTATVRRVTAGHGGRRARPAAGDPPHRPRPRERAGRLGLGRDRLVAGTALGELDRVPGQHVRGDELDKRPKRATTPPGLGAHGCVGQPRHGVTDEHPPRGLAFRVGGSGHGTGATGWLDAPSVARSHRRVRARTPRPRGRGRGGSGS
jgi:hypothetical protein